MPYISINFFNNILFNKHFFELILLLVSNPKEKWYCCNDILLHILSLKVCKILFQTLRHAESKLKILKNFIPLSFIPCAAEKKTFSDQSNFAVPSFIWDPFYEMILNSNCYLLL